jgi:hypothetical protein
MPRRSTNPKNEFWQEVLQEQKEKDKDLQSIKERMVGIDKT